MLTDDGYRQLMKHAKRLAQEGHGELAQHLRDAIDLRAEVEEGDRQSKIMLDSYADENQRISDERDRLRAEVEALRADAQAVAALLPGPYYMDPPDGGSVTVIEQLRRMAADAARYRWLRAQHWHDGPMCVVVAPKQSVKLGADCPSEERLDALIYAARAAQGDKT
jgi:hypothetical protein